jgi:hypothetical protein
MPLCPPLVSFVSCTRARWLRGSTVVRRLGASVVREVGVLTGCRLVVVEASVDPALYSEVELVGVDEFLH